MRNIMVVALLLFVFTSANAQITFQKILHPECSNTKLSPFVKNALMLDYCEECQAVADQYGRERYEKREGACSVYGAMADYCWWNCAPCSFCVRYNQIKNHYCNK